MQTTVLSPPGHTGSFPWSSRAIPSDVEGNEAKRRAPGHPAQPCRPWSRAFERVSEWGQLGVSLSPEVSIAH